jgi:hypothetical protein
LHGVSAGICGRNHRLALMNLNLQETGTFLKTPVGDPLSVITRVVHRKSCKIIDAIRSPACERRDSYVRAFFPELTLRATIGSHISCFLRALRVLL